jgi:hypothetical protein
LVIKSDILRFIVFADCSGDAQTVISRKIRKDSRVLVQGKFQSSGAIAFCLFDCWLQFPEGAAVAI